MRVLVYLCLMYVGFGNIPFKMCCGKTIMSLYGKLVSNTFLLKHKAFSFYNSEETDLEETEVYSNSKLDTNSIEYGDHSISRNHDKSKYINDYINSIEEEKRHIRDSMEAEYASKYNLYEIEIDNRLKSEKIGYEAYVNKMIFLISIIVLGCLIVAFSIRIKTHKKNLKLSNQLLQKEKDNSAFRKKYIENITHEIKTPLTQISGVLEFLKNKTGDKELLNLVQIGSRNSAQLKYDIEHILQLMRSDSYSNAIYETKTNLQTLFWELIEDGKLKAFGKGLSIHIKHNLTAESYTYIDQEKLSIIFLNFFTNGIKFSKESDHINVNIEANRSHLYFSVENYGSYISEKDQERIFERYYQVDEDQNKGHGIGLSIVKDLSKILNAKIGVYSNFDTKKTEFYCRIDKEVFKFSENTTFEHTIKFEEHGLNKKEVHISYKPKVLVVDDNTMMIEFYKNILKSDFNCDFSLDGEEAFNKIQNNKYDCIVSDILMPNMDGFQLVNKIKETIEGGELIPIIFVTGSHDYNTKSDALNIGVHDVILKPFIIKELITRIHNVITNRASIKKASREDILNKGKVEDNCIQGEGVFEQFNENNTNEISDNELLNRIIHYIDINLKNPDFEITELATCVFYSTRQLNRKTVELTGLTPGKLILERRLVKAYTLLQSSTSIRVSEVQIKVGIKSSGYFYTKFKDRFGVTPSSVRKK